MRCSAGQKMVVCIPRLRSRLPSHSMWMPVGTLLAESIGEAGNAPTSGMISLARTSRDRKAGHAIHPRDPHAHRRRSEAHYRSACLLSACLDFGLGISYSRDVAALIRFGKQGLHNETVLHRGIAQLGLFGIVHDSSTTTRRRPSQSHISDRLSIQPAVWFSKHVNCFIQLRPYALLVYLSQII